MTALTSWVEKSTKLLLDNYWYALFAASFFALLPFFSWLSVIIVALVTLRQHSKKSMLMLVAVIAVQSVSLRWFYSPTAALMNAALTFIPCYIAAFTLRISVSWQMVYVSLLLQVAICLAAMHAFVPEIIITQFRHVINLLHTMQPSSDVFIFLQNNEYREHLLANWLIGVQSAGMVISTLSSLIIARALQSRLYYPGGFRQEMLNFRADKWVILLSVGIALAAQQDNFLAINMVPMLVMYLFFGGFCLGMNIFFSGKIMRLVLLIGLLLVLKPLLALGLMVTLGMLDGLTNIRFYLVRYRELKNKG